MIIPIRTDRRLERTPVINPLIIAVNVAVFMLTRGRLDEVAVDQWILSPLSPRLMQFIGYQFLHADIWHLAGNMLFLYIFGNAVEDRLGRTAYLFFYLAGGVCAGLGHAMVTQNPVLGASGSVAAVSGAFLALMPKSQVTIFYWFIFYIGAMQVSAMIVIGVYFAIDVFRMLTGGGQVAYMAHMAGYVYGFTIAISLLASGLLEREPYDMLTLWKHRRRREQFRAMSRQGYQPWQHSHNMARDADTQPDPKRVAARSSVMSLYTAGDIPGAAAAYVRLLETHATEVLPKRMQLDIANQLMAEQHYDLAADAYERYIDTYPPDADRTEVELILGLICVRYLDRRQRGRELLAAALPRLRDTDQADLARQALGEIDG